MKKLLFLLLSLVSLTAFAQEPKIRLADDSTKVAAVPSICKFIGAVVELKTKEPANDSASAEATRAL